MRSKRCVVARYIINCLHLQGLPRSASPSPIIATMPAPQALQAFARFYNTNFDRRPVPTLMITNGLLNTLADAVAQSSQMLLASNKNSLPHPSGPEFDPPGPAGYDFARTMRFAVFGVAMGPLIGVWMRFLERQVPLVGGSRRRGVQLGKRVFMDQFLL
jgi:protein Mpv17